MQIGNRVLSSYDTNIQEQSKLEHVKQIEQPNRAQSSVDTTALKEGTVFRGEILDIVGEKVKIAMDNKAQLMARLQGGVELGVGDRLLFSVKENTANQILIKPMFDSLHSAQTQVLERALDGAGLSPTEKNFSVAKELMEAGMPLDKGSMVKLLSQSMKFEGTSMQTLVALNKMNIPVTEANITQFERYQGYQHQLSGDISNAADSIATFTQAFPEGTNGMTLLSVAGQIVDMFLPEQATEGNIQNGETLNHQQTSVEMSVMTEQGVVLSEQGTILDGQNSVSVEPHVALNQQENIVQEQAVQTTIVEHLVEGNTTTSAENTTNAEKEIAKHTVSLSQITENTGLTKEGLTNLSNLLSKVGVTGEQMQNIFQNANSSEELLKNMLQTLATSGGSEQAIRSILDSNEFRDMLSDLVKKNWALNPKDMKDPKEIDELYDKIVKQSKSFENMISANGGEPKQFEQSFQNMRQNMQFMEQLNNQMIYAQMPLKLSNQNANSELYVYADKRKLAQKKDGISVMLHLDMDHLGQTDVKVTLTGSNVNARFYLNDQESVDIIVENMNQLAKQLADRGFSLTNEVVKRQPQESINKVVDEIIDENAERSIKRYTFDART